MVRRPRLDGPGRFHHVFNRAARRQVLFADRRDFRFFQLLVACAVRRGELKVHAYCLLSTHFHMLVTSPDGRLSYAMMRIQNSYARYLNRRRRLDGPVFRGRFGSRPVLSHRYYRTLTRYIAFNPVGAGLANGVFDYPYASSRFFAADRSAAWFDREGVARILGWRGNASELVARYAGLVGTPLTEGEAAFIKRRMERPHEAEDALDELYQSPPPFLARWMERKIRTEGGASPWQPVVAASAVIEAVAQTEAQLGAWCLRPGRKPVDAWSVLAAGLLHALAGLTTDLAGALLRCHGTTASRRIRLHRASMLQDETYAHRAGLVMRAALDATFPQLPR